MVIRLDPYGGGPILGEIAEGVGTVGEVNIQLCCNIVQGPASIKKRIPVIVFTPEQARYWANNLLKWADECES